MFVIRFLKKRSWIQSAAMAVGRVFMSSAFLLCYSVPLLFSVEDAEPQHRASISSYPWSFWDEFKSNSNEFNLDLLPVPLHADGHFAPLTRKKLFRARVAYFTNHTASFNPVEVTLVRSGNVHPQPGPVKHSDSSQERHVTLAHINARSFKNRNHFILINEVVLAKKFDILCVSESWLDSSISDIELDIPGYNIYRLDRTNKPGGGVCTFVKQNLKVECLQHLSSIASSGLHQLWLKIQAGNYRSFLICTVYRPPSSTLDCFDNELCNALTSAMPMNKPIYILGDLNCNLLNSSDPASQALVNFCTSFNLSQMITQPTRVTESSATLIDVILTSHENLIIDTKVMPSSISDHDLIYAVLKLKRQRPKPVYLTTRIFKNYQQNDFLWDISMVPWCIVNCFDDIDDRVYTLNTLFSEVLDKTFFRSFIPKKSASMRSFSKDDRTVANNFNRFFTSVGQVAVDKINSLANECNFDLSPPVPDPAISPVTHQFNFMHVDCYEVAQIIRSMPANKSSGIDNNLC